MSLPPFPVDEQSLALLEQGCGIDPGAEHSSLLNTLEMFSMLGGSDPEAVEEEYEGGPFGAEKTLIMRDPFYSTSDCIVALIEEIRRLRRNQLSEEGAPKK